MSITPKLKYYFVAGVEGVGHHGLNPVLKATFKSSQQIKETNGVVITNKKRLKRVFNALWCHENPSWITKKWAKWYSRYFFDKQKKIALKNNQVRIIIEDNSFPAGIYRNPERQWNLQEMIEIISPYADIYFIGLYRDPIASTYSRQNIDGGLFHHAPVVKASLISLNKQLALIDPDKLLIVHYEDMVNRQSEFSDTISKFLDVTIKDVKSGLKEVRKSKKDWRKDLSKQEQEKLLDIFKPSYEKEWPILSSTSVK